MAFYRKKPVVIEAVQLIPGQWPGDSFINGAVQAGFLRMVEDGALVKTLEGEMLGRHGDWIIKGVNGEYYPCKPDIFRKTYDPLES